MTRKPFHPYTVTARMIIEFEVKVFHIGSAYSQTEASCCISCETSSDYSPVVSRLIFIALIRSMSFVLSRASSLVLSFARRQNTSTVRNPDSAFSLRAVASSSKDLSPISSCTSSSKVGTDPASELKRGCEGPEGLGNALRGIPKKQAWKC